MTLYTDIINDKSFIDFVKKGDRKSYYSNLLDMLRCLTIDKKSVINRMIDFMLDIGMYKDKPTEGKIVCKSKGKLAITLDDKIMHTDDDINIANIMVETHDKLSDYIVIVPSHYASIDGSKPTECLIQVELDSKYIHKVAEYNSKHENPCFITIGSTTITAGNFVKHVDGLKVDFNDEKYILDGSDELKEYNDIQYDSIYVCSKSFCWPTCFNYYDDVPIQMMQSTIVKLDELLGDNIVSLDISVYDLLDIMDSNDIHINRKLGIVYRYDDESNISKIIILYGTGGIMDYNTLYCDCKKHYGILKDRHDDHYPPNILIGSFNLQDNLVKCSLCGKNIDIT